MAVPYWEYLPWAGCAAMAVGIWRYAPLALVRLVAAFTNDEERHRRCMEVLRLARRDASNLPTYLTSGYLPPRHITDAVQSESLAVSSTERCNPALAKDEELDRIPAH